MSMVWTSPVIRELHGSHSPLSRPPTLQEEEWLVSLLLLGGTFGPIVTFPLTRHMGRRPIILSLNIPLLLGWVLALLATNIYFLYTARFLWGCTMGISFMIIPIYIGEIAEDNIRGALGAIYEQNVNVGFFLGFLVGRFANYWGIAWAGTALSLVYLGLSWILPETPLYLVYKGRNAEASKVLQRLRGVSEDIASSELKTLEETAERECRGKLSFSDLWETRGNLKALGICVCLGVLMQLVGITVILFYMEGLFVKVNPKMSAADAPVIVGAVQAVTSSITPLVVERLGRRFLMYSTTFCMAVVLTVIGIYSLLESYYHMDVSSVAFLPLVCVVVYIIMFTWGVGPVPIILWSEMFPLKIKCLATTICSSLCWFTGFIITRFYSDLTVAAGQYGGFWMLAFFGALGALFSFFALTETKGKSFEEIQDMLNNRISQKKPDVEHSTQQLGEIKTK